uniref:N-acetyltransferase domain-containing protein n=1 Tax=Mantoniella antarctica TaxID=81844 RepID=A0A7S0T2X9_9CHLO
MFLRRMMSLYIASHYKNTPNDLQLMADAPAHRLFVLLAPMNEKANALPEILCVIQVSLEGAISRGSASATLAAGHAPQGDLVPWTVATQFQDPEFPSLTGARIVRIATHPDLPRQGYGSRALSQLHAYYEGKLTNLAETDAAPSDAPRSSAAASAPDGGLLKEVIKPRAALPPLLTPLGERRPERVHWVGAAFGLTQSLYSFWTRAGYQPVYLRQTTSDVTGEHSAILIRALDTRDDDDDDAPATAPQWLTAFSSDFRQRFTSLLGGPFRNMPPGLALAVLAPRVDFNDDERAEGCTASAVVRPDGRAISAHDVKRLEKYAQSLVDHHLVADLVPPMARSYFAGNVPASMSYAQSAILLSLGLQHKEMDDVARALGLPTQQVMALFNKAVRKMHGALRAGKEREVEAEMPTAMIPKLKPLEVGLDEDLEDGAAKVNEALRAKQKELLEEAGLERFAIAGQETDWDAALSGGAKKKVPASGLLSVKRKAGAEDEQSEEAERTPGKKDGKRDRKGGSTPGGHKSPHGKSPASHGKSSSKKSKGGK